MYKHDCYSGNSIFLSIVDVRLWLPKGLSGNVIKDWVDRRRKSIRPWASFVDQRKFAKPRNFGELCQRVVRNLNTYHSNYTFIFLGLILYCM